MPEQRDRVWHHSLLAFVANTWMAANVWLHPGNSHTGNNAPAFLDNTQNKLGHKRIERN